MAFRKEVVAHAEAEGLSFWRVELAGVDQTKFPATHIAVKYNKPAIGDQSRTENLVIRRKNTARRTTLPSVSRQSRYPTFPAAPAVAPARADSAASA